MHGAHRQTDVRIAVGPLLGNGPAKLGRRDLQPLVHRKRRIRGNRHAGVPLPVRGIGMGPRPAILLARDEVWRARPALVGSDDLRERPLQEDIVTIREDHQVIFRNTTLIEFVLDDLLEHEELQRRRVAVYQDVSRPLREPDDAQHAAQLCSGLGQGTSAGVRNRVRESVEVYTSHRSRSTAAAGSASSRTCGCLGKAMTAISAIHSE
mmetsp:Transcript_47807/g.154051  ORF Transcript_47807/g.154051 Transcript_47807/m.154051 type:complete len:208 (+) Transcript_47807:1005-1628(+)